MINAVLRQREVTTLEEMKRIDAPDLTVTNGMFHLRRLFC